MKLNTIIDNKFVEFILLLLICIPVSLPLLGRGFFEPHDLHHLADIYEMYRSIATGQIPPRFAPDFLYNYGYPLFNFYYPLPFYVGATLYAVGFSLVSSFKGVFLITVIFSVIGMYHFLKLNFSKIASFAGAVLFLYTPYRAVQIYVRGAMGEAFALAILPWVLWILIKIVRKNDLKLVALGSLFIFFFFITHNYLWFLSLPFFILYLLIEQLNDRSKKAKGWQKRIVLSALLGFSMSSYWLVPALIERKYIEKLTPFMLEDHFPFVRQLIIPSWGYGSSVWGPGDEISFQIGIVNLITILLGLSIVLIYLLKGMKKLGKLDGLNGVTKLLKGDSQVIGLWALTGFLLSFIFMNIRTLPIWKLVPFYNFIQFPWRLLFLTTFFSAILMAYVIGNVTARWKTKISILVVFASIVLTVSYFKPSKLVYKNDNEYMNRMFATQRIGENSAQVSIEHENWSEDYLLLPNWSDVKPNKLASDEAEIITGKGVIKNIEKISPMRYNIFLELEEKSDIGFNKLYFPGWVAYVDGNELETEAHGPFGSIKIVDVPKGTHEVKFGWEETELRFIMDILSVLSLFVTLYLFLRGNENPTFKKVLSD